MRLSRGFIPAGLRHLLAMPIHRRRLERYRAYRSSYTIKRAARRDIPCSSVNRRSYHASRQSTCLRGREVARTASPRSPAVIFRSIRDVAPTSERYIRLRYNAFMKRRGMPPVATSPKSKPWLDAEQQRRERGSGCPVFVAVI